MWLPIVAGFHRPSTVILTCSFLNSSSVSKNIFILVFSKPQVFYVSWFHSYFLFHVGKSQDSAWTYWFDGKWRQCFHYTGSISLGFSLRIGFASPSKTNNSTQFSYRVVFTMQHFRKWYEFYRIGFTAISFF